MFHLQQIVPQICGLILEIRFILKILVGFLYKNGVAPDLRLLLGLVFQKAVCRSTVGSWM
jgi:hypothetical protein